MRLLKVLFCVVLLGCAPEKVSTGANQVHSKAVPFNEISLDLRPRTGEIESELTDHSLTDTTSDGLPWWIETLPDSMRTTISDSNQVVRFRVYLVNASDQVSIQVNGPRGVVRSKRLDLERDVMRSWSWNLRDSVNKIVPNGLYEALAKTPDRVVVGYVVVKL